MVIVAKSSDIRCGDRLHITIDGRVITIFRDKNTGELTAMDSVCYHAAGPLTNGDIIDIEDLNVTVVSCPHHNYMVSIHDGTRVYQKVDIIGGKPQPGPWIQGKVMQRPHQVSENKINGDIEVILNEEDVVYPSDADSNKCHHFFKIHSSHSSS